MPIKPTVKEIERHLNKTYNEMVDSFSLEALVTHFYNGLKLRKDFQKHNIWTDLTNEKIAILENAVKKFEAAYEKEKDNEEKMPLLWLEAKRVRNLFEEIDRSSNPPPDKHLEI